MIRTPSDPFDIHPIDYFTAADADPLCGCGHTAVVETWDGPRCRIHGDVIEPDAFALDAMSQS